MAKIAERVSKFFGRRGSPALSPEAYLDKLQSRGLGPDGRQVPDPDPLQPPVGYVRQPSMVDIIRAQVRDALDRHALENDMESFEDADDFEIDEDPQLTSGYENDIDPPIQDCIASNSACQCGTDHQQN